MKTLYLLRGLPGSGKSTLAQSIMKGKEDIQHFEADQYFTHPGGEYNFDPTKLGKAHGYCKSATEHAMVDNVKEIIVTNTFTQTSEMGDYFILAERYGYRVFSLVVENRHGGENIHSVPKDTIEKMARRFNVKII